MNNWQDKIVPFWKPIGISSYRLVAMVKRKTGEKKVGHAGTLDPLAEGVLVLGIGRNATRRLADEVKKEKEYLAEVELGAETETYDREGKLKYWENLKKPSREKIEEIIKEKFTGKIKQTPPPYSALKINGQRAYKLARAGKEVSLLSRPAMIKKIEIIDYKYPSLTLKIVTGPGVYIRSIAHDLGRILNTGGYLKLLKRTRVGEFTQSDCFCLSLSNKNGNVIIVTMKEKLGKIKNESQELKKEVGDKITGYITAAFGLIAGLAWNDAIKSLIEYWFPMDKGSLWAKFIYAFVLTLILVIVTVYLVRFFSRKDSE